MGKVKQDVLSLSHPCKELFFLPLGRKATECVHVQSPVEDAVFHNLNSGQERRPVQTSAGIYLTEQLKLTQEYVRVDRIGQNAHKQCYATKQEDKTLVYNSFIFYY